MAHSQGLLAPQVEELRLLKVPKWLSEAWAKAPSGAAVMDLDIQTGTIKLLPESGCYSDDRPSTLTLTRRASPELFAFSSEESSQKIRVEGGIVEVLQVKADLQDIAYRGMLRQRAEDGAITTGTRSIQLEKLHGAAFAPEVEVNKEISRDAVASNDKGYPWLAQLVNRREPGLLDVQIAVDRCLKKHRSGVTVEELLQEVPRGADYEAVCSALVSVAEIIGVPGEATRYRHKCFRTGVGAGAVGGSGTLATQQPSASQIPVQGSKLKRKLR